MIQKTGIILCTAVMLLIPLLAKAEVAQTPRSFLEEVYDHYRDDESPLEPQGRDADMLFDKDLAKLIRQDREESKQRGEVPILDGDPICDCQEHGDLSDVEIAAPTRNTTDSASATVIFADGDEKVELNYDLVREGSLWKIYDISNKENGSLRKMLSEGLSAD
jgi:hypothetical protein